MQPLVVPRRPVAISLATLPAVGIAVLSQVMQSSPRGVPLVLTVALLAACAWVTGRMLVSRVRLDDQGLAVRGLLSDMTIGYDAIASVAVAPAPLWTRRLLWGLMEPHAVEVHLVDGRTVSPIALWASAGDAEVGRVVTAIRTRLSGPNVPRQRTPGSVSAGSAAR